VDPLDVIIGIYLITRYSCAVLEKADVLLV